MREKRRVGRSRRKMSYHGRECHPIIHEAEASGRPYIMVRARGGGTKQLYLDKRGAIPRRHR